MKIFQSIYKRSQAPCLVDYSRCNSNAHPPPTLGKLLESYLLMIWPLCAVNLTLKYFYLWHLCIVNFHGSVSWLYSRRDRTHILSIVSHPVLSMVSSPWQLPCMCFWRKCDWSTGGPMVTSVSLWDQLSTHSVTSNNSYPVNLLRLDNFVFKASERAIELWIMHNKLCSKQIIYFL